ncbi:TNR14 factor, partial [Columbina picui]|nr:TNR14 factor [Columbina picui]
GFRVFRHCTASSSTTCVPCANGTYTDRPNGFKHCSRCKLCDEGASLVPEVACTHRRNTVCGCAPGYFCSHVGTHGCELCQRYTVCFPGSVVKERGTKTTDNVCEACPPGTYSTANMPYTCTPRSEHKGSGPGQGEDGNPRSDSAVAATVFVVAMVLLVAAGFACVCQRRKRQCFVP